MAVVSAVHLSIYAWKLYQLSATEDDPARSYHGRRFGLRAILDICNPWDLFKSCGRAIRWVFGGRGPVIERGIYVVLQNMGVSTESRGRKKLSEYRDREIPETEVASN